MPGLRISDLMPLAEYRKTAIYNDYYRRVDADYQMGFAFGARDRSVIGIAANRKKRDFSDEELFIFNVLRDHTQQAFEICQSLDATAGALSGMTAAHEREGRGVVCFDRDYRVLLASTAADELAWDLFQCRAMAGAILPDRLLQCVLALKGPENAELPAPRIPLAHRLPDGSEVLIKLVLDMERGTHCLIFEREQVFSRPEQLAPLGLTKRETEVAFWVLHGKTNWEISIILGIASRTVDKHVENLFVKTKVHNRAEFTGKARKVCDWK